MEQMGRWADGADGAERGTRVKGYTSLLVEGVEADG
jgi:hypothetical protein